MSTQNDERAIVTAPLGIFRGLPWVAILPLWFYNVVEKDTCSAFLK